MAELRVRITVAIDEEGWEGEHVVAVPPDYSYQDIQPFVLHEADKAMTAFQSEHFGRSRSAEIIRQFDRRLVLIRELLGSAPHGDPVVARIRAIIDMDSEQLFTEFGEQSTGD